MVKNSEDKIPLTQSPSITQETKARFNELLSAALSREASNEPQVFKISNGTNSLIASRQANSVPKIVPRQKLPVKSLDVEKHDNTSSIYSSGESSDNRKVKRKVIAEVHTSRTQLLISSSDEDILSQKKEKRKKKKSRWKQATESAQLIKEEGQKNASFQMEEGENERSSSRLSNRSYVIETPTFPAEKIKSLTSKTPSEESSGLKVDNKNIDASPTRLSNRSYTIESPTFPIRPVSKDKLVLAKGKTPIPLPRRKSLKPSSVADEDGPERTLETKGVVRIEVESRTDTVITIHDTASQETEDDLDISRSAVVKLQDSIALRTEEDGDMPLAVRKLKRKNKRRKRSKSRDEMELQELNGDNYEITSKLEETLICKSVKDDRSEVKPTHSSVEKIVGVTVHGVDCPLVDQMVCHPLVRLYVVDTTTGEYYKKSDPQRSVCYFGESTNYVPPIMTHPFDFKQHRSVTPAWEECLLLNDSFGHLITASTLLLFELVDFVPAAVASARYLRLGQTAAWCVLAWAFLRPQATNGSLNVAARLRLQLYKPGRQPKALRLLTPAVYEWWGTAARDKYAGCLYVTVTAVDPPTSPLSPRLRSRMALQVEQASVASVRSASAVGSDVNSDDNQEQQEQMSEAVVWSRLAAQSCKVPNTRLHSLPVDGSMCVQFSDDGLWLACAKHEIQIYSVPQFQHSVTLAGHQGLVYSLRWSGDSKVLLSASADCTVCVWRPSHRKAPLLQMLAHPSFVYCAQFLPTPGHCSVVSGCCDSVVRLWQGESHSSYQLTQELSGHAGFVTSVCVTVDCTRVVSADSLGSVRVYDVDEDGSLSAGRELRVREVRGTTINNLVAHPGGHRLLVHTRDGMVRSVDLPTGAVLQTFKGCSNQLVQTGMCVSACGGLVFACGEDGTVTVWSGHTGSLRAVYCGLLPPGSAAVHYHPHEHMLALASLEQPPVYILIFDRNASGEDIGLNLIRNEVTPADVIEKIKLVQSSNKWQKAASKAIPSSSQTSALVQGVVNERKKKRMVEKHKEPSGKPTQRTNWPSLPEVHIHRDQSPNEKDLRLLEIIRKMDSMILAAKQSSQS